MDKDRIVTPGEKVADLGLFSPGYGIHTDEAEGALIATLVGRLETRHRPPPASSSSSSSSSNPTSNSTSSTTTPTAHQNHPHTEVLILPIKPPTAVPFIGGVVIGRVTRVTPRAAHVEIVSVEGRGVTTEVFKGMVRQQDVRQTETDKVEIYKCFVPGDLVRADVISLGDRNSYYLATAKNELGVTYARSKAGVPMVAINWQEMQCPTTMMKEFRKVAKQ